ANTSTDASATLASSQPRRFTTWSATRVLFRGGAAEKHQDDLGSNDEISRYARDDTTLRSGEVRLADEDRRRDARHLIVLHVSLEHRELVGRVEPQVGSIVG